MNDCLSKGFYLQFSWSVIRSFRDQRITRSLFADRTNHKVSG